jgi:hypothetical protein
LIEHAATFVGAVSVRIAKVIPHGSYLLRCLATCDAEAVQELAATEGVAVCAVKDLLLKLTTLLA